MKTDKLIVNKLGWLTASAVGVLLAAQGAVAADDRYDQQQTGAEKSEQHQQTTGQHQKKGPEFSELDTDDSGELEWQDIESEYEQKLEQANWDEEQVFSQFDTDNSESLNEREYDSFQTALNAQTNAEVAAGPERQREPVDRTRSQQQAQQEPGQQQAQRDPRYQQDQAQQQQPGQQQQQAQAGQQDIDTTLLSMPVDQVMQANVVNSRGEDIGSVSRIVRDNTSGQLSLVVESGGILGLGGSSVLVDLSEVSQMGEDQLLWDTMLSEDEIAEMPEFDETQYSEISEDDYSTLDEARRG